jgi:hypothetical protein
MYALILFQVVISFKPLFDCFLSSFAYFSFPWFSRVMVVGLSMVKVGNVVIASSARHLLRLLLPG